MKLALGTFICSAGFALAVQAEPVSSQMSTRAATAEMQGDPQGAIKFADEGIAADPANPWPYYNKGEALARLGKTDAAVATFSQAEQRFGDTDHWGRSVAIFGRAHALAQAKRCQEARAAFQEYAAWVKNDPNAVQLARRYSDDCDAAVRAQP
jgi:tetratricopeptide (TPR) repeat protein